MLSALIAIFLLLATVGYWLLAYSPESKKWYKYFVAYLYFKLNKKKPLFDFKITPDDLGALGVVSLPHAWTRESPRPLLPNIHAADIVRFWGANKDGMLLYVQISRRHQRVSEILLHLHVDDDQYQLPLHPHTAVYNTDGKTFSNAGLCLEILEPLRKWTLKFDGYLRRVSDGNVINGKLNFILQPMCNYTSFPEDFSPNFLAKYLADTEMKPWDLFKKMVVESHQQFSQVHGLVEIEGKKQQEVVLRGMKERAFGCVDWKKVDHLIYIEVVLRKATAIRLCIENVQDGVPKFVYGYLCPPCNMTLLHMTDISLNINTLCHNSKCPTQLELHFTTGKQRHHLKIESRDAEHPFTTLLGEEGDAISLLHLCDISMDGHPGDGILHFISSKLVDEIEKLPTPTKINSLPLLAEPEIDSCKELVLKFTEVKSRSSQLVGGKGASLALMTNLQSVTSQQLKFKVPPGVNITKTAFQLQIEQNPKVEQALQSLQQIAKQSTITDVSKLKAECEKVVELIGSTPVSPRLKEELVDKLVDIFGEDFDLIPFAVRSSAVGEDGEEMSAAGQNETFLGVRGLDDMLNMISKCWASQFAFRSVEYKRHNGQLLSGEMGVVIQQMVPAQIAGVLFSRHPFTGSPAHMVITANYGLGESVVSASADPDTIVIQRSWDDQLNIHEVTTGGKKSLIQMSDNGGTVELETDTEKAEKCCLSEEMALNLASLAVQLEKYFGNARDIEWAVDQKQQIFILQSRPVTTGGTMSDFEATHEFNTPLRTDEEYFTTANVAEVMPGSQTVLTLTSVMRGQIPFFQELFQWKVDLYKYDPTVYDGMGMFYGHCMFDLVAQKGWSLGKKKDAVMKGFDIGIYGRVLDDDHINERALERFEIRPPLRQRMVMLMYTIKGMIVGNRMLNQTAKIYKNYRVPLNGTEDVHECYRKIGTVFTKIFPVMNTHMAVTMASTMWNMITLNILSQGKEEYSSDQYADFALLVGSCNGAESGNVPASLGEIAEAIMKAKDLQDFVNMDPKAALEKLRQSESEYVKSKFSDFLNRHGHRGLKEFDLSCVSWGIDPLQVVKVLQGMLVNASVSIQKPKEKTCNDVVESIKSPLTPFKKWLLKKVMNFCRASVCHREQGKTMLIKYFDAVRLAYRHLARLMIAEGMILEEDLIFFFTHEELGQLINTRSPKLIRRAKQRRKIFRYTDQLLFAEMLTGFPRPLNESKEEIAVAGISDVIKGVPVSQGVIQGPARVVESFHNVHTIKAGEILITHATDIGWSPYFPMLSGIVTEIGGLISHGAVVAREFGLPCIVGVDNATKLFQSGDIVLLDATKGTIVKVKNAEN